MTESVDSVALYRTRKLLRELSSKTGKGTELISLYIPPKKALHEVLNNLREEYGTATNIKSDSLISNNVDLNDPVLTTSK